MRSALVHRELQGSLRDFRMQRDPFQSRVSEERGEFRDPEDYSGRGEDQDRVAEQVVFGESASIEGLGFCGGLRGSYVDDAAAREGGRLRGGDGGVAYGGGVSGGGIWVCWVEVERSRGD
ncbi:hypothetical protein GQ457_06G039330 [Hibiscus cannabinus]